MHYLSHYYVELPNDNPLFVAALAIPDLCSGFSRLYNSIIKKSVLQLNELEPIQRGIEAHYAGDKRFHASVLFAEYQRMLVAEFMHQGLNRERLRLSVLAHIGVEQLIDRQIVIQQPEICATYYRLLYKADLVMLSKYFDILLPESAKKRIFSLDLVRLSNAQFISLFGELHYLVYGLNRTYQMVTGIEFTEDEKILMLSAMGNIDATLRYSWKGNFESLKPYEESRCTLNGIIAMFSFSIFAGRTEIQ